MVWDVLVAQFGGVPRDLVSENLRTLDQVAYIRFVSVYKAFSEPQEFLRELDAVLDAEIDDFEDPNRSQ